MKNVNAKLVGVIALLASNAALAQDATTAKITALGNSIGYAAVGIGLMIGLAVLGGTLSQGRAAAAALDGIARNPGASGKMFVQLILSLALIESLVLAAWFAGFQFNGALMEVLKLIR